MCIYRSQRDENSKIIDFTTYNLSQHVGTDDLPASLLSDNDDDAPSSSLSQIVAQTSKVWLRSRYFEISELKFATKILGTSPSDLLREIKLRSKMIKLTEGKVLDMTNNVKESCLDWGEKLSKHEGNLPAEPSVNDYLSLVLITEIEDEQTVFYR